MTLTPVRELRRRLETLRLEAVELLASQEAVTPDSLRRIADIQTALTAVREEIELHSPRVGYGEFDPLE